MVERWWDEPISRHANIFLAAAGDQSHTQAMRMYSTGVHGNLVHEVRCDIRDGYIRVMRFVPRSNQIEVCTFSPTLGRLCGGTAYVPDIARHQFSLPCELTGPVGR